MTVIWAWGPSRATKRGNNPQQSLALEPTEEIGMADDKEKVSTVPNDETIAGTGPGIADDALSPGEDLPEGPSDEEVEDAARALHSPTAERDTLPLEGE
jgi:hypothetical protein